MDATQPEKNYVARGWDESDAEANKMSTWIKLGPGESVEFAVVGAPECFETSFERDGVSKLVKRWSIDVWVTKDKQLRVWEMSRSLFLDLKRQRTLRPKLFPDAVFMLERQGTGLTTKWNLDYLRQLEPGEIDLKNAALMKGGTEPDAVPF